MHVLIEDQGELVLRRAGIRQRARAWLRPGPLDRELAAGRAPVTDPLLAVRALRLCRPGYQHDLARSLGVLGAARGCLPDSVSVLAGRLAGDGPITVRGVALANSLLSDGAGPLHRPGRERELDTMVSRALTVVDESSTTLYRGR